MVIKIILDRSLIDISLFVIAASVVASCSTDSPNVSDDMLEDNYFIGGSVCVEQESQLVGAVDSIDSTQTLDVLQSEDTHSDDIDCSEFPEVELFGDGVAETGQGTITIGTEMYDVNGMVSGEIELPESFDHYGQAVLIHDGEFRSNLRSDNRGTKRLDWGVYNASIAISIELFARNGSSVDDLEGRSFDYDPAEDIDAPTLSNSDVFLASTLFIDDNADGVITQNDRILRVTSGQITWLGGKPELTFVADLGFHENTAIGLSFTGDYSLSELPKEP